MIMKNSKALKIFVLLLSTLLLAGVIFGISAMAEGESEDHKVEILFNNLEYKDNTSILYAAQVNGAAAEGADLSLNFYTKDENGVFAFDHAITNYVIDTVKINDITYPVYKFKSIGIAPKDMTKVIYAQLVATIDGAEYKSNISSFSITEYCYKRLYKDTNASEDQRELYQNFLATGVSIQKVLKYDLENTPADYYYVSAEGAAVNSVVIDGTTYDINAGIFKAGTLTLPAYTGAVETGMAFKSWNVAKTGAEAQKLAAGAEVAIDNHIILTPFIDSMAVKFEDGTTGNITVVAPKNSEGADITSPNFISEVVTDRLSAENKVLHIKTLKLSTAPTQGYVNVPVESLDTDGNCYVLSYDFMFDGSPDGFTDASGESPFSGTAIRMEFVNGSTIASTLSKSYAFNNSYHTKMDIMASNGSGATVTRPSKEGVEADTSDAWDHLTSLISNGTWINIRIELYKQSDGTYIHRIFFNDMFIAENHSWNKKVNSLTAVKLNTNNANCSYYLDNVSFYQMNKEYEALEDTIIGEADRNTGYFADSSKTGSRFDYTTTNTKENGITISENMSPVTVSTAEKDYVSFYRVNYDDDYLVAVKETSNSAYFRYETTGSASAQNNFVVEMDAAFSDIGNSAKHFMVLRGAVGGASAHVSDLYISTTGGENSQIVIGNNNPLTDGEKVYLNADTWYKLRFVFGADNSIQVYVNGEYKATFTGQDTSNSATNGRLQIQYHSGAAIGAKLALDNIFIGYEAPAAE